MWRKGLWVTLCSDHTHYLFGHAHGRVYALPPAVSAPAMAVSAKRKQEEKHLKMLREMTSLPPNRKCFDCDQRGPTYANMTVGSFVCTTCSGILRGLNPPHRFCRQIWLGLYDDRTSAIPDFREPQKVKEFLQEKYEKKRWYVPLEQAKVVASVHASISGSSASSTSSTPEVRPLKTLLGDSAPTLSKTTPSQSPVANRAHQVQEKKFDLLNDLGGDIFAGPPSQVAGTNNFANFARFNNHPGGGVPSLPGPSPAPAGTVPAQTQPAAVGGDRYAALAELDSALSYSSSAGSGTPGNVFGAAVGVAPAPAQQILPSMPQGFGAPFGTGSMSMPAGFGNSAAYNLPTSFSGSFQQPLPGQGPFPQPAAYPLQPNGGAGCAPYGHGKPMVTPFGQVMSGPGVSSRSPSGTVPNRKLVHKPFLIVLCRHPATGGRSNPLHATAALPERHCSCSFLCDPITTAAAKTVGNERNGKHTWQQGRVHLDGLSPPVSHPLAAPTAPLQFLKYKMEKGKWLQKLKRSGERGRSRLRTSVLKEEEGQLGTDFLNLRVGRPSSDAAIH
ncbi:hypothetical protein JZ751_013797 [Albula glossodonta]|uniref:Arf-GAP domain-containing protein n=1 Tax=Albula glossodonta TaxID=121402 RepID=A0A8T2P4P4_9TELE|nr:hypothetical protein JZ751_013797 [Albula glossodonta]